MPRTIIAATLAALLSIPTFAPVIAAAAPSQHVVVRYGDLDLGTVAGRSELNNRVRTAAGTLCSPVLARRVDSEPSIRKHKILYDACVERLTDRAMHRIDARL
jgi:UrcA family protein